MRKAGWVFPILVFFQFSNIFGKQNLPVKCGTPFILSGAKHSLARPIMDRYSDTRHFRIWYSLARPNRPDTTDINPQNGIPDYVDKVKDIFEYCYSMIINTFGYLPPIPDSSCEIGRRNVGGDDRIDVYIMELYGSYYGETVPDENLYNDPTKAPGYIIIDNDYMGYGYDDRPIDALKVTAAHEFFHLAQFAYDYTEDIWWMEATAVFMEEQLYPYVNDYIAYIGDFLAHPEIPLNYANTSDNRIYGTSLFPIFLSRRFGWAIVKSIWEYCARPGFYSMSAIRRVIEEKGSNFRDEFGIFSLWNLFTGSRADTSKYYPDGHLYPLVSITDTMHLSAGETTKTGTLNFGISTKYILLPSLFMPGNISSLSYSFTTGDDGWFFAAVGFSPPNTDWKDTSCTDTNGTIEHSYSYSDIIFVGANSENGGNFFLNIIPGKAVTITDSIRPPYPNPVSGDTVWFPIYMSDDGDVCVAIYTQGGNLIKEESRSLKKGPHYSKDNALKLTLENRKNKYFSNNIYIYVVKTPKNGSIGKLAIIR